MRRHLLIGLISALSLSAPASLAAPGPAAAAAAGAPQAVEADAGRYVGSWALTDSANNLFNVILHADGSAGSTIGTLHAPMAGARLLDGNQLRQIGRWRAWGNGVRVDYGDGWTDWLYMGPAGLSHASWAPGSDRGALPSNSGPAVRLTGRIAEVVGVYSFSPAQKELKPYTATLMSNGLAFNDIDERSGGIWSLSGNTVLIEWVSGWRTTMSLDPATPLQLRHWAPGEDRRGPGSGPRQGRRLD